MVEEQFKAEDFVDKDETRFQFDTSNRELSISIEFTRLLPGKWAVSKETTHNQVIWSLLFI